MLGGLAQSVAVLIGPAGTIIPSIVAFSYYYYPSSWPSMGVKFGLLEAELGTTARRPELH
jgi:hypothetical protein